MAARSGATPTARHVIALGAIVLGAVLAVVVLGVVGGGGRSASAFAAGGEPPPSPTVEAPPSDTVSDFYPQDENLSDCVGLVEKPGCGSDSRGGWRQTVVFGVVIAGIAIIIWRITVAVRRSRPQPEPATPPDRDSPTHRS